MTTIKIKAKDYIEGIDVEAGVLPYGQDVIHNASPYNDRPNSATYRIVFPNGGTFILFAEYAAAAQRPVRVLFNDQVMTLNGLSHATGGWNETYQVWEEQIPVQAKGGANVLKIASEHVFPHIRSFAFVESNHYSAEVVETIKNSAYVTV